ncbi:MAG: endopeptidase La [Methylacidiphilales bacterium]|nr:endopeptidase La [Candidatus Methylacidiphilales bacterium]
MSDYLHIPYLPLRDVVLFPNTTIDIIVGRERSVKSIFESQRDNRPIIVSLQTDPETELPQFEEIYVVGVLATIIKVIKSGTGTYRVTLEGHYRMLIEDLYDFGYLNVNARQFKHHDSGSILTDAQRGELLISLQNLLTIIPNANNDQLITQLESIDSDEVLLNTVSAKLDVDVSQKQELLSIETIQEQYEMILDLLKNTVDSLLLDQKIKHKIFSQIEKNQKDYFIHEQIRALQKELSDEYQESKDFTDLEQQIIDSKMSVEASDKARKELARLKTFSASSPEASVVKTYLHHLIQLPWQLRSKLSNDLNKAKRILDSEHYALVELKTRVLEYLAVQKRTNKTAGSILCFVGPPGVGKTSLARSIALATNREFIKFSVGGVRDESEIRGHRRTYIGSMPGRIIQNLIKVKVKNPVILIDEIDKMGSDFRGDPASALLEVLDPEQNSQFVDHYTEVSFDLSEVLFITTANTLDMPKPLLDRLEIIHLYGYSDHEKFHIANNHLIPKQQKLHGIQANELELHQEVIYEIIQFYTRESGVRQLERSIAKISRKHVFEHQNDVSLRDELKDKIKKTLLKSDVKKYLGVRKYRYQFDKPNSIIGQVTGLAWTEFGGDILHIEATTIFGRGGTRYTGSLGNVMKESIDTALTIIKRHIHDFDKTIPLHYFNEHDFHVHVPEGAIPKDGPSAGLGMTVALFSAVLNIPVYSDVAMTGEVTLRGSILPIGGLREKLLAAQRAKIKKVLIPAENAHQLEDIPDDIKSGLDIIPLQWFEDSFIHLFNTEGKKIKILTNKAADYRNENSTFSNLHTSQ